MRVYAIVLLAMHGLGFAALLFLAALRSGKTTEKELAKLWTTWSGNVVIMLPLIGRILEWW